MNDQGRSITRKHKRFPFREDVLVEGAQLCSSMDISEGGLFISAMQHFEKDNVVQVGIPVKGEKIMVKAQVRHCQPGVGLGVMFIDLDDEQRAEIKELVENIEARCC